MRKWGKRMTIKIRHHVKVLRKKNCLLTLKHLKQRRKQRFRVACPQRMHVPSSAFSLSESVDLSEKSERSATTEISDPNSDTN